jgi:hypothetical protein
LLNFNSRLSGPAKDVLSYFKQQTQGIRMMRKVLDNEIYTADQKKQLAQALGI